MTDPDLDIEWGDCATCGEDPAHEHFPLGALRPCGHHCNPLGGPSGPPPLPRGRIWDAARRRQDALTALARVTTPRRIP